MRCRRPWSLLRRKIGAEFGTQLFAKDLPLLLRVAIAVIFFTTTSSPNAQTPSPNAQTPKLHLISPTPDLITTHFPAVNGNQEYASNTPLDVLVENETDRAVTAFVIKWVVTYASGGAEVLYTVVFPEPPTWAIPGAKVVLAPGRFALVNPVFHLEEGSKESLGPLAPLSAESNSALARFRQAKSIHAVLDGAVFGNHVLIGKDSYGLESKFTCEHNAAIAEAQFVNSLLSEGKDPRIALSQHSMSAGATDATDVCSVARGRAAFRLLQSYNYANSENFHSTISRLASLQPITLKRLR
jgi:hypothetical protein